MFQNKQTLFRLMLATCGILFGSFLNAQPSNNRYYPLDHNIPGKAGDWAASLGKYHPQSYQPVQFDFPSTGVVTIFQGSAQKTKRVKSDVQAGFLVGPLYRLKLSQMPEFPGLELYPTIELLDRLHPPRGKSNMFPLPVQFTKEEIKAAISGRLLTKVVYLEHPRIATPHKLYQPLEPITLPSSVNLLKEADNKGRPMAIIRLGGRIPSPRGQEDSSFYGTPHSVSISYQK